MRKTDIIVELLNIWFEFSFSVRTILICILAKWYFNSWYPHLECHWYICRSSDLLLDGLNYFQDLLAEYKVTALVVWSLSYISLILTIKYWRHETIYFTICLIEKVYEQYDLAWQKNQWYLRVIQKEVEKVTLKVTWDEVN